VSEEDGPPTKLEMFAERLNRGHQERHAGDRLPIASGAAMSLAESGPVNPYAELESRLSAEGVSWSALLDFKLAARALKAAEIAFHAAQQTYAKAVKRLSEEAVK